jgi:hypothetical protein
MKTASGTGVLELSHASFAIVDDEEWPPERPPGHTNGLVVPMSQGAVISTGIHTGAVTVIAEVRRVSPALAALEDWDEVVEVSFVAPVGQVRVATIMSDVPEGLPLLTPAGPGSYRLRLHAKGRDTNPDGVADDPFETYLLIVWPGPAAAEIIYKTSDGVGAANRQFGQSADSVEGPELGFTVADDPQFPAGDFDDPDDCGEPPDEPMDA